MLSRQAVRGAHHAATAKQLPAPVERVTKLGSGLTVASFEMHGPLSQLVLAFRAGTRYEQSHQNGLVHAIRCFAGRDTNSYPGSSVVWSAADSGANIRSFATRDVFGVAFTVTRDQTARALSILGHAGAQPAFKPWELEDVLPLVRSDIAHRTSYDIVFDDIHRAAFRNSALANPLYAPTERVGKVSTNDLAAFAKKHLVTGSAILYGTNIDHDTLIAYGENHSPIAHGAGGSSSTSDYKGGEVRRDGKSSLAHVILAGQGAEGANPKGVAAQTVLLTQLGQSASVKFQTTAGGDLGRTVSNKASASGFQTVYADAGLAGVYVVGESNNIREAVKSAAQALKTFKVGDIEVAKKKALNNALRAKAHTDSRSIERATQVLTAGEGCYIKAISEVKTSDVEAAAKKIVSKLSIASYGNVDNVPYLDEL